MFRLRNNYGYMPKMRTILKALMKSAHHNAYDIARERGISPSTIGRYLSGKSVDLKPSTVKKLADFYGISESQLRGDLPIEGMEIEPAQQQLDLQDLLSPEEYRLVGNLQNLSGRVRDIIFDLAETLVQEQQAIYEPGFVERRRQDIKPNRQLRISDFRPAMPSKRRLDNPLNGTTNSIRHQGSRRS